MWANGEVVFEDNARHGANPLQRIDEIELKQGWNPIMVKVENGSGGTGLYLRFLNTRIQSASDPTNLPDLSEKK